MGCIGGKWFSVGKKLPRRKLGYLRSSLVYVCGYDLKSQLAYATFNKLRDKWVFSHWIQATDCVRLKEGSVTHWQIPKPPTSFYKVKKPKVK